MCAYEYVTPTKDLVLNLVCHGRDSCRAKSLPAGTSRQTWLLGGTKGYLWAVRLGAPWVRGTYEKRARSGRTRSPAGRRCHLSQIRALV